MNALIDAVNHAARAWWPCVLHASWQAALVAAVFLAAVRLGRRWSAQLRYGLLLLALLKFAVPPMLPMPTGLFSRLAPAIVLEADGPDAADAPAAEALTGRGMAGLSWQSWLMVLHALGAALVAGCLAAQAMRLARLARSARAVPAGPLHEQLGHLAGTLGLRRRVRLLASPEPVGPVAFGLVRPSVMVPAALLARGPREHVRAVLLHELAHHRRGDIWVNWFQGLLAAAWWFHPLFWLLSRDIRRAREDCCDDLLLARRLTTDNAYCRVLLDVAGSLRQGLLAGAALGLAQRLHPLSQRMRRIMDRRQRRVPRCPLAALAVTVLLAAAVLPGLRTDSPTARPQPTAELAEAPASQQLGAPASATQVCLHPGPAPALPLVGPVWPRERWGQAGPGDAIPAADAHARPRLTTESWLAVGLAQNQPPPLPYLSGGPETPTGPTCPPLACAALASSDPPALAEPATAQSWLSPPAPLLSDLLHSKAFRLMRSSEMKAPLAQRWPGQPADEAPTPAETIPQVHPISPDPNTRFVIHYNSAQPSGSQSHDTPLGTIGFEEWIGWDVSIDPSAEWVALLLTELPDGIRPSGGPVPVPEPACLLTLAVAALAVLRTARRRGRR